MGVVGALMLLMMYLSSRGVTRMTYEDKQRALEKTLAAAQARVDLRPDDPRERRLGRVVDDMLQRLRGGGEADGGDGGVVVEEEGAAGVAAAAEKAPPPQQPAISRPRSL